jgi:GT2 family glycosyltransferase
MPLYRRWRTSPLTLFVRTHSVNRCAGAYRPRPMWSYVCDLVSEVASVSAVVVSKDGAPHLEECLASLFAQTQPPLEVILVDNGTSDGSIDAARKRFDDRLLILRNERNEGFARGNNQAFAIARGDWIFLLNNDAAADARTLEALLDFAEGRSQVGMLACRIVRYDAPQFFDSTGLLIYPDGVSRPRGWEEKDLGQYDDPAEVLAPHGCACAYRRRMLDEVGDFDEDYFAYLEDLDLGMRAQLLGWKCWYVPEARVRHRKSSTFGNYSRFKAYHVERNRIWNAVKLLPRFILLMSPLFTINRYLLQAYAAGTHQGLTDDFLKEYTWGELAVLMVRAYAAALLGLPRMVARRRELSRRRKITVREWYELISRYKLDAIELALKR